MHHCAHYSTCTTEIVILQLHGQMALAIPDTMYFIQ